MIFGAIYLYRLITSQEERKIYKLKLIKQVNEKKKKVVEANHESKLQKKLNLTGLKLSALKFQAIRIISILVISAYYIIVPLFKDHSFSINVLTIPAALFILTEPTFFKYSLVNFGLEALIKRKQRKKIIEVFTLFDVLKADLYSLKSSQEVNIYNILRDSTPMFEYINGTLSRLLSVWKTSPEKAKNVLFEDIGEESTKILGDIIYKLDHNTKEEALKIIEAEASVFSFSYYESELQRSGKTKTLLYGFFTLTSVLIIAWLVIFVLGMFNDTIANNNVF